MLRAAHSIAFEYSHDRNVLGTLIRQPIPDDPDFPQTCDVELALVAADLGAAAERGYLLTRRTVDDVLIDVCAISKDWLRAPNSDALKWILSLGDPRAFEVFCDYSKGELTRIFPTFKKLYLGSAAMRVSFWLEEAKRRLDYGMNVKLDPILRLPEAAFSLVYLSCALLDSSGRSFAGSFLKLPRNLRWLNEQLASELGEYLPATDKDPIEAARIIPELAGELSLAYPPMGELTPQHAAEAKYNFSPLEVEYRSFVTSEIAARDKLTALWYARAWATYLVSHFETVMSGREPHALPPRAFSNWREILGNPDQASIELFVGWVDELYGLCVEACEELRVPTKPTSSGEFTMRAARPTGSVDMAR